MPSLRNSLNIRSRVMWVRAFFNTYKRRVIAAGGVIQNEPCAVRSLNNNLLRSASWTLVPSGIEEDIVFAQKPSSGLGDLVMTRASDATYTDASGVVRRSPYNLLQQSEMFSNAAWGKSASTIGIDAAVAPNGTLTADNLIEDTSSGLHFLTQAITVVANTTYTGSIYIKANTRTKGIFRLRDTSGQPATDGNFDLTTGTISFGTITNVGGGWYRLSLSRLMASTSASLVLFLADNSGNISYTGNGTSGIFAWGAQLVEGSSALDYFPTTNRQDVPRIDFRNADGTLSSCGRLLLEPQRTNSIRNSSMVGAVAGSPGTLPTNWSISNLGTLTRTVVGTGTENGLPYIDYRIQGTALNTTIQFAPEPTTQIAATNGQAWASSYYLKSVAGTIPDQVLRISQLNSGGTNLATNTQSIVVDGTLKRYNYAFTMNQATTAFVFTCVQLTTTVGATYDFTIRIAAPQMELGAFATTWVPTTTAAVTRLADAASKTGVSSLIGQTEGTLFVDLNLDTRASFSYFVIAPNISLTSNYVGIFATNNTIGMEVIVGSVLQAAINLSNSSTGRFKIAVAYKANDFVMYMNGTLIGTDTNGTVPTCSQIGLYNYSQVASFKYNQAALFQTRLDNATLAQLTTL